MEYTVNQAHQVTIAEHLWGCDKNFVPPLSSRVEIASFAKKLKDLATRWEAWDGNILVGLVACYSNDKTNGVFYITNVSVLPEWMNKGVAHHLIGECVEYATATGMRQIELEVAMQNWPAIKLYAKCGFVEFEKRPPILAMRMFLAREE